MEWPFFYDQLIDYRININIYSTYLIMTTYPLTPKIDQMFFFND